MYGQIAEVSMNGLDGTTSLAAVDGLFTFTLPNGQIDTKKVMTVGGIAAAALGAFFLYKKGKLPFFKPSPTMALYDLGQSLAGLSGGRSRRRRRSRR